MEEEERNEVNGKWRSVGRWPSSILPRALAPLLELWDPRHLSSLALCVLDKIFFVCLDCAGFRHKFSTPPFCRQNEYLLAWRLSWQAGYIGSGKPCNSARSLLPRCATSADPML